MRPTDRQYIISTLQTLYPSRQTWQDIVIRYWDRLSPEDQDCVVTLLIILEPKLHVWTKPTIAPWDRLFDAFVPGTVMEDGL